MNTTIYLDHAAATPLHPDVLAVMQRHLEQDFYNPSATYLAARGVADNLAQIRSQVAQILGARPSEVIFTAGGTEANNLAIYGVMSQYPDAKIVTSSIEHESVLAPAGQHGHIPVSVKPDGVIDMTSLQDAITDDTVLVSVMYANNEIGTIQPLRQIALHLEAVRKRRLKSGNKLPLWFHTDACQAANYLDLHVSRLGVDMMTLNAGKIYGPKQSGVLYVSSKVTLRPHILGGGQERGLRSGTENIASAAGFAKALGIAQSTRKAESERLQKLQHDFINGLMDSIPAVTINGSVKHRLPNNAHLTIPGQDNERLVMALDEAGVLCAVGSACSASSSKPSHVLEAIGLTDEQAQASLRLTFGRPTTADDLAHVLAALRKIIA